MELLQVSEVPESVIAALALMRAQQVEILRRWACKAMGRTKEEGVPREESKLVCRIAMTLGELAGLFDPSPRRLRGAMLVLWDGRGSVRF